MNEISRHYQAKRKAKENANSLPLKSDITGTYLYNYSKKEYKYKGKRQSSKEKKIHTIRIATKSVKQYVFINHKDYFVVWCEYNIQTIDNCSYIVFDYNDQLYCLPIKYSSQEVTINKYNPIANEIIYNSEKKTSSNNVC